MRAENLPKFRLRSLCALLTAGLTVSALSAISAAPSYTAVRITDAGYRLAHRGRIYWMDVDRILFYGGNAHQDSKSKTPQRPQGTVGTYSWRLSTGRLEHVSAWEITCFSDDFSTWMLVDPKTGVRRFKAGPLGKEVEVSVDDVASDKTALLQNPFTCRSQYRSELIPPASRRRTIVPLRQGDGYLDLGPGDGPNLIEERQAPKKNLVLHQATGKPVELLLTWDEKFTRFDVSFSAYKNTYVLRPPAPRGTAIGISGDWPKGQPVIVHQLWIDGNVSTTSIPYSVTDYLAHPQPMTPGWIFGGGRTRTTVGLYLFDGNKATKLDIGQVHAVSVSSDGCKAAAGISNRPFEMGTPIHMKVFDLCGETR